MPVLFNESEAEKESVAEGVTRQTLLDKARTGNDFVFLYRWEAAAGSTVPLSVPDTDFAWAQVLDGSGTLTGADKPAAMSPDHIVLLPPGFDGAFAASEDTVILQARVPDAVRFDAAFADAPPAFKCIDWTCEPVLDAENDARKRIYLVSPKLFGTKAFKGEMIIYPPGTVAGNHHHEGAEHFQYIVEGAGTVILSETPHDLHTGDIVYNYEFERHYFQNGDDGNLVFVEFFVPGEATTVWPGGKTGGAWLPTGKDIRGRVPAREIAKHSSSGLDKPQDL